MNEGNIILTNNENSQNDDDQNDVVLGITIKHFILQLFIVLNT